MTTTTMTTTTTATTTTATTTTATTTTAATLPPHPHRHASAVHSRLTVTAVAALAIGVAAGCSPPERRPDIGVEVPEQWSREGAGETPVDEAWWRDFSDVELDSLVGEVIERNHDLRAAAARLDAALAQARIAGAELLPVVSAGFNASRERRNFIGLPIPGGGDVLVNRFTQVGVSLDTAWEVDLWGRVRAATSAAIADAEAASADYAGTRVSLAGQAAKAWFALTEARLQVELAEATAESWRASAAQVRSRFEQGTRPALDLRLALSNLASAEAAREARELERESVSRQLEILLGRYPAGALAGAADLPSPPGAPPGGLPSELMRRRADIVAAERRLAAADRRIWQARASLFPRISLTASGGTTSDDIGDLANRSFSVWSIGANALQPLFESGRLLAGIDLAKAEAGRLLEEYAGTVLVAFREVEVALAADVLLAERERFLTENVAQAAAAEELALERYLAGLESYVTVLESQRRTALARSTLLQVRRQRLEARVDLYLALGGGFDRGRLGLDGESEEEHSTEGVSVEDADGGPTIEP